MFPPNWRRNVHRLIGFKEALGCLVPEDQRQRSLNENGQGCRSQSPRKGSVVSHRKGAATGPAARHVRLYRLCHWVRLVSPIEGQHRDPPDTATYQ